ncbi:MAG: hypothetical protein JNL83_05560 [Myxococcales bacterium]|nr:hypothetical protein [Myxococcales bacterium]
MATTTLRHKRLFAELARKITAECSMQGMECSALSEADIARMDARGQELSNAKQLEEAELVFLGAYAFRGQAWPLLRVARLRLGGTLQKLEEADALVTAIEKECAAQKLVCR